MNNAMITGLNVENPGEKKKRASEDLALVRESIGFLQSKMDEGLSLNAEESEELARFMEAEKSLESEIKSADNDLGDLIKELQDARKKSSDIMDMGKAVQFKEGVSIDNVNIKKGFAREISPRRNKETIERDTEKLFERHKEEIKAKGIGSVKGLFALFYPERLKGGNNNMGKWETEAIKAGLAKIRG